MSKKPNLWLGLLLVIVGFSLMGFGWVLHLTCKISTGSGSWLAVIVLLVGSIMIIGFNIWMATDAFNLKSIKGGAKFLLMMLFVFIPALPFFWFLLRVLGAIK